MALRTEVAPKVLRMIVTDRGVIRPQRRSDDYDPATNAWTRVRGLPEPIADGATAVDGSNIWLVGGFLNDVPGPGSRHVWKYDTRTNTYARGPDLPAVRGSGFAAIVGRTLHFIGGGPSKHIIVLRI